MLATRLRLQRGIQEREELQRCLDRSRWVQLKR